MIRETSEEVDIPDEFFKAHLKSCGTALANLDTIKTYVFQDTTVGCRARETSIS
jgi:hypothetical protein